MSNNDKSHTQILNTVLQANIDPTCLAVWCSLQSRPNNWKLQVNQLRAQFGLGRDKVYQVLNKLIAYTLLKKVQERNDDGTLGSILYIIQDGNEFNAPFPDLPDTVEPDTANQDLTKERVLTKERKRQNSSANEFAQEHYRDELDKEKLKMTKQEVKDEFKQQEGDPQVRGRIRQLQRQAAMNRMMSDVPKADVIITNPTHFSVALKYDQSGGSAPVMLAKGGDFIALKIREVGNHYDIPVIQSPALARAIYFHTEIGDEIPEGLFKVVAQLLAYVYQLRNARMGAPMPGAMPSLDVPEEFQWDGS